MNKNLKRISVSVDEDDYQELKDLSRAGLSIGFLIREAIHDFLARTKKKLIFIFYFFPIMKIPL